MTGESDRDYVERCLDGHRDDFRHLVRRYEKPLLAGIRCRHVRPDAAEDVAQEALLRAFANLASLRKPDSFFSWLLGIAYHVLQERADRDRRERAGLARMTAETRTADAAAEPWPGDAALEAALAALPDQYPGGGPAPLLRGLLVRRSRRAARDSHRHGDEAPVAGLRGHEAQPGGPRPGTGTPMPCDIARDDLIAVLESTASPEAAEEVFGHLEACEECRAAMEAYRALQARLEASARASVSPALERRVMALVQPDGPRKTAAPSLDRWPARLFAGARAWRLGLGTAGLAVLAVAVALIVTREPSQAWSMEASIEATRPFRALHLRGSFDGSAECELWARSSADRARSQRLLIRIGRRAPILIWTEGNATHYYDPGRRTVYTDDAHTAGFNPWPGPKLFAMAQAAGVRMIDTRWRLPGRRTVVVE